MTFEEMIEQAVGMLQRRGCVTYRALQAQFQIDDNLLDVLKEDLLYSQPQISDDGRGLIWTGEKPTQTENPQPETDGEIQARYNLARTHLDLASLTQTQFNLDTATTHLSTASTWFQKLQIPKWAEKTGQLAQEYGVTLTEVELEEG